MLRLKGYDGRDLQHFLALLSQFEAEGITDVRFVRQRLGDHVKGRFKQARISIPRKEKTKYRQVDARCPECGSAKWRSGVDEKDGTKFYECKSCRYSRLV